MYGQRFIFGSDEIDDLFNFANDGDQVCTCVCVGVCARMNAYRVMDERSKMRMRTSAHAHNARAHNAQSQTFLLGPQLIAAVHPASGAQFHRLEVPSQRSQAEVPKRRIRNAGFPAIDSMRELISEGSPTFFQKRQIQSGSRRVKTPSESSQARIDPRLNATTCTCLSKDDAGRSK